MPVSTAALQAVFGTAWHTNSTNILNLLGHASGSGSPVGVVTPLAVGQTYFDTVGQNFWTAYGLTSSSWDSGGLLATTLVAKAVILAPLPADLVSIVAALTPSNVALTLALQPPQARKLQIRIVIGTTTTTAITAGSLALVGTDQDGNAVSETISLIENASATVKSAHAYAALTSATVSAYAANGSGTGNTVGIGRSNDFGVSSVQGVSGFALIKASKIITTFTPSSTAADVLWARAVTDDIASTATVDAVARTIAPTTAPGTAGINDYEFTYSYSPPA